MFRSNKVISMLLCMAMLVSCMAGLSITVFAADAAVDTVVECESGKLSGDIQKIKDSKASGGQYIMFEGGDRVDDPAAVSTPDATYTFNVPADGTYYLFMRVLIENDGKDSFHFKWNNNAWETMHPGAKANWQWMKVAATGDGGAQLKAGKNTLTLTHREWGGCWDALFLTTDISKVPKETGSTAPATTAPTATASTGTSAPSGAKVFEAKDGQVMIEAEEGTINKELYSAITDKAASGGKAIQAAVDAKDKTGKEEKAGAEYNVKIDKAGSYNIWMRYCSLDEGSDSSYWSLNNDVYKDTGLSPVTGEGKYGWSKAGSVTMQAGSTLNIRIRPRESRGIIDKIIVISNAGYIPTDMGTLPKAGEITVVKLPDNVYPKPSITPPAEHPRLLLTAKDIPTIKANLEKPQNKSSYDAWRKYVDTNPVPDGNLPVPKAGTSNYNATTLAIIESWALDYVLNGNAESAAKAVTAIKNYAATCNYDGIHDYSRNMGQIIFTAALVYDWCYPVISAEDRALITAACESIAPGMEIGYPPSRQSAVCGHAGEAQLLRDLLSFGIATYNERPDIYNYCAGRFLSEFIVTRDFWYTSHTHHQGDAYGPYRYTWDIWSAWIYKRMSGIDIYKADMGKVPYEWIYNRRSDGQLFRNGDCFNEGAGKGAYWAGYRVPLFYAANYYGDEYLKWEFMRETPGLNAFNLSNDSLTPVQFLIFNNPDLGGKPVGELALSKYFGSPNGTMVARTGWNDGFNAPEAIGVMKIGEHWGANHNHLDAGNFQLYYKGILASESGFYESYGTLHDGNYNKRSVAHNTILVYDPDEAFRGYSPNINDGGQRFPNGNGEPATMAIWMNGEYETGKVLGHEFDESARVPEYSYVKGDITKAYTSKVKEALRSMVFMPLDDPDHPAAMVVMDKVEASNANFKKSWLLHMQQEPQVAGNKTTILRNTDGYNGRMVNTTLLPKDAKIEKIGGEGKESWVNDQNLALQKPVSTGSAIEAGWGRIEVSPGSANKVDYFLNVMVVSDADTKAADVESTLIEGDSYVGAAFSDRVAIFAKDAKRIDKELSFTIPGSGSFKVFVSGIKEGTWTVSNGGEVIVTADGGVAYFQADSGKVTLTYKNATAVRNTTKPASVTLEGINIKVAKKYIYTDVPATIKNDRTLVPMRAIFEALDAELNWNDTTKTATASKGGRIVQVTSDSKIAKVDGVEVELDVPAQIVDGRFLVPLRFVSESFYCTVEWDAFSKTADIRQGVPPSQGTGSGTVKDGCATIASCVWSDQFEDQDGTKSYDNNIETLWSCEGDGQFVEYQFDKEYEITSVYIYLNKATERQAYFDILSSNDGKNWTKLKSFTANGKSEGEVFMLDAPVKTKYMKYVGHGNSANSMWNAIKEIEFRTK